GHSLGLHHRSMRGLFRSASKSPRLGQRLSFVRSTDLATCCRTRFRRTDIFSIPSRNLLLSKPGCVSPAIGSWSGATYPWPDAIQPFFSQENICVGKKIRAL